MSERTPVATKNLDGYGSPELPWARVQALLDDRTFNNGGNFVATTRPDGRPHAVRVGTIVLGEDIVFVGHETSRRSRNLAENPAMVIVGSHPGLDLTFEGTAVRVTDPAELQQIADAYVAHGWPAAVDGDQITAPYNAPSAGPAPWNAYRFRYNRVFAGATADPYGATRFDFAD
jgi:hypothetical protein